MSKEHFGFENIHNDEINSEYIFVCPQCSKEIKPSSVCEDCFPNGSCLDLSFDQDSFYNSEVCEIDEVVLEDQSGQEHDKIVEENSENEHLTWQDFHHLLDVISTFYKRYKKKAWLVSSVFVLLFAANYTYQHIYPKGKLILFMEKKDLVFSYSKKPLEKHVIEKNLISELRGITSNYNYYSFAGASRDEKYIFYQKQNVANTIDDSVDRETGEKFGIYYRYDVESNKKLKIDDQVHTPFAGGSTNISADGSKAVYLKGTDSKLVFWNNGKRKTIDEMVSFYLVNKQTTQIFYAKLGDNYDNQGGIYEWSEKSGKKKVAENAELQGLQIDQKGKLIIYYKNNQSIYCKMEGKKTRLISYNADRILSYTGDKVYYTVPSPLPFTYRDFVNDTLVESDKEIMQSSNPFSGGQYNQKLQRDIIRESFNSNISTIVSDLFYFDGEKSILIDKNISVNNYYSYPVNKKPLLVYRKMSDDLVLPSEKNDHQKIDIKNLNDLSQLDAYIYQLLGQNSKVFLAQGVKKGLVEQNTGSQFRVSSNGKWVGFIDDSSGALQDPLSSYFAEKGKLKKFRIDNLAVFKPTIVDENVNASFFFGGNDLFYTKGTLENNQIEDLYVNGKELLANVDFSRFLSTNPFTFYEIPKASNSYTLYGLTKTSSLYRINNVSKQEIAKKVQMFVPLKDNGIIYMKDYNSFNGYGSLIFDDGKNKPVLITKRASMIFQNNEFLMY